MRKADARTLTPEAQEWLRRRVVAAILNQQMRPTDAARTFGIGRTVIYKWLKAYENEGDRALRGKSRGRPKRIRMKGYQAAQIVRAITKHCPNEVGLPFWLWTREAVQQLLRQRYGIRVSIWTVGRYLKHWGFTPQKPLRRAYEQDPKAVRRWLQDQYPAIQRQALQENAEIHWLDEMGVRAQDQGGRSYGRRGHTPVVPGTGQRFGCNMISTITNQGHMRFMVFKGTFTAEVMIRFLRRLVRQSSKNIILIDDRHPVHQGGRVQAWIKKHSQAIREEPLPTYSPNLNPGEYLNQDVKGTMKKQRPHDQKEMVGNLRSYLRSTQRRPDIVRNYFHHPDVRYAKDGNE
jgi:transposase